MKPGLLTSFLTSLFLLSALVSVALAAWYLLSLRQLHNTHRAFLGVNHNKAVARQLIAEAFEYRRRNPAIEPVLRAAQLIPALNTNAPATR